MHDFSHLNQVITLDFKNFELFKTFLDQIDPIRKDFMKICNQNDCLLDIDLNWHIIVSLNFIKGRLDLKVNESHDFFENVLIDKFVRELDETGVVGEDFVDLSLDFMGLIVVIGKEHC